MVLFEAGPFAEIFKLKFRRDNFSALGAAFHGQTHLPVLNHPGRSLYLFTVRNAKLFPFPDFPHGNGTGGANVKTGTANDAIRGRFKERRCYLPYISPSGVIDCINADYLPAGPYTSSAEYAQVILPGLQTP